MGQGSYEILGSMPSFSIMYSFSWRLCPLGTIVHETLARIDHGPILKQSPSMPCGVPACELYARAMQDKVYE